MPSESSSADSWAWGGRSLAWPPLSGARESSRGAFRGNRGGPQALAGLAEGLPPRMPPLHRSRRGPRPEFHQGPPGLGALGELLVGLGRPLGQLELAGKRARVVRGTLGFAGLAGHRRRRSFGPSPRRR
eukprot:4231729-Alexandrium_andersonii.AAC.1